MTIDRDLVTPKLLLITRDLGALRDVAATGVDRDLQSRADQAIAERYLERMIGRMIDINYHVITVELPAATATCSRSSSGVWRGCLRSLSVPHDSGRGRENRVRCAR